MLGDIVEADGERYEVVFDGRQWAKTSRHYSPEGYIDPIRRGSSLSPAAIEIANAPRNELRRSTHATSRPSEGAFR